MRNLILLGIAALALNPAVTLAATDAEIVTEMATKCWKLPKALIIKGPPRHLKSLTTQMVSYCVLLQSTISLCAKLAKNLLSAPNRH